MRTVPNLIKCVAVFGALNVGTVHAQQPPQLTDAQKSCLQQNLPSDGSRPDPSQMNAIFESCGIQPPPHGRGGRGGGPFANLSDTQKSCLKSQLGEPGSGTRPTRDQMDAAFAACGIQKPQDSQGASQYQHQRQFDRQPSGDGAIR